LPVNRKAGGPFKLVRKFRSFVIAQIAHAPHLLCRLFKFQIICGIVKTDIQEGFLRRHDESIDWGAVGKRIRQLRGFDLTHAEFVLVAWE